MLARLMYGADDPFNRTRHADDCLKDSHVHLKSKLLITTNSLKSATCMENYFIFLDAKCNSVIPFEFTKKLNKLVWRNNILSLGNILISLGESLNVLLNGTMVTQELHVGTINLNTTFLTKTNVFLAMQGSETPVLGDNNLLATGELVHGTTESLDGNFAIGVAGSHGQEDLANVDSGNGTVGLAEGTTHTGLETIGTCARQHLVDTDNVERMGANTKVETFLSSGFHEVPFFFLVSLPSIYIYIFSRVQ